MCTSPRAPVERFAIAVVLILLLPMASPAQISVSRDLTQASLEDLMNIQVTSVSKKEQHLSKSGAAVYVITREDIRRSAAANIPDLLRMAPGVDVAQLDANQWAISIRGFNSVSSNKILLMVDGRALYVNTFSGAFWDQLNVPLENIERIEVIRGPGGTVWGANAVNGIVNIITKSSRETKGGIVSAAAGSKETAAGLVQYGADIGSRGGSRGAYRVFGRYFNINNSRFAGGQPAADGWRGWGGGFRSDWDLSSRDTLLVEGDLLTTAAGATMTAVLPEVVPRQTAFNVRLENTSGDVLGRWEHILRNGSETSLQVYYNTLRRDGEAGVRVSNDTADVEFRHHTAAGERNDLVWGLDYRVTVDDVRPFASYSLHIDPPHRIDSLFSVFVQDEIKLTRSVFLTLGSKFEHNAYTGFEYEPSAQLVWVATDRQAVWTSAARAIRQPARSDSGVQLALGVLPLSGGGAGIITLFGNPNVKAEHLDDYAAGYRAQITPRVSVDVTGFLSYYHQLQTTEPQAPFFAMSPGAPHLVIPLAFDNLAHARNYGAEVFANWNATHRWKISPGYSLLEMAVKRDPGGQDPGIERTPGSAPKHQFQMRSQLNLRGSWEWDSSLMYVSSLQNLNIPGYVRVDTRLGWRVGESLEFNITGQNLLAPRHLEFFDTSGLFVNTEAARSLSGKVTWRF